MGITGINNKIKANKTKCNLGNPGRPCRGLNLPPTIRQSQDARAPRDTAHLVEVAREPSSTARDICVLL